MSVLQSDYQGLHDRFVTGGRLPCSLCYQPLLRMAWNSTASILCSSVLQRPNGPDACDLRDSRSDLDPGESARPEAMITYMAACVSIARAVQVFHSFDGLDIK